MKMENNYKKWNTDQVETLCMYVWLVWATFSISHVTQDGHNWLVIIHVCSLHLNVNWYDEMRSTKEVWTTTLKYMHLPRIKWKIW